MKILVWLDDHSSQKAEVDSAELAEIVGNQLGYLASSVSRVMVSIRDTNAHKGGIDKICRVTAHLRSGEVITISEHSDQITVATGKASGRLQAALSKALQRKQLYRQRTSFAGKTASTARNDDSGAAD